ncbi:MAG: hypothetical protein L0J31_04320, partial [Corynebacterium sp.]|nr:hypothetical protein [Corynebacterium sp.]
MGSLSDFTDIISEVLQITLGLIRGDLTVLSTEGSLEGVFDTSSEWDLTGSLSDITGSLAEGAAISGSLGDG